MTSPMSTALGCTNELGSTTGVTPLIAHTLTFIAPSRGCAGWGNLAKPGAGVAEHAHPRRILAPRGRVPRHLHAAKDPLGVWHENGKATVRRGEPRDAVG